MIFQNKNTKPATLQTDTDETVTDWLSDVEPETEGQLAIDVYQNAKKIVIKSTIAGVKPEDLKISLHHDLLTIKGTREADRSIKEDDYLYRECYWGSFSRSVILPAEVDGRKVEAELENGVLTITLYKTESPRIEVKAKD
jgi:HSP20 family protein